MLKGVAGSCGDEKATGYSSDEGGNLRVDLSLSEFCDSSLEPPRHVPEVTLGILELYKWHLIFLFKITFLFLHVVTIYAFH